MVLKRLRSEQSGAVMVIAAVALTSLLLFAGLALDFGRAHLLKAHLQTAVDASALAGALQVVPMVELQSDRWQAVEAWCTDPVSKKNYLCLSWEWTSNAQVSGTEWDLIRKDGWQAAMGAQCSWPYRCVDDYTIVRDWLVLPPSTHTIAEQTFHKNQTWPGGSHGVKLESLQVFSDPIKVEVTTVASLSTPTSFLRLIGINQLRVTRTGSAIPIRL
jgi:hypothetical protein